jgi:hypothetical protein
MNAVPNTTTIPVRKKLHVKKHANGKPYVDQDPIEIWSTNNEELQFVADDPRTVFYVCFPEKTPFAQYHYSSADPLSGPIQSGATGEYKYNLEIDGEIVDPIVIIRP